MRESLGARKGEKSEGYREREKGEKQREEKWKGERKKVVEKRK